MEYVNVVDPLAGIIRLAFHSPDAGVVFSEVTSKNMTITLKGKNQVLRIDKATKNSDSNYDVTIDPLPA